LVLRRLSVFADDFTLEAATAVISDGARSSTHVCDPVVELVSKSLIVAEIGGAEPRFRLSKVTHAYAQAKLVESGEFDAVTRRKLEYFRDGAPRAPSMRPISGSHVKKLAARPQLSRSRIYGTRASTARSTFRPLS
jgi:predicted ATPase